ncbi:hypothetical protein Q5752_001568 [Cryptotrichosporon argae]
MARETRGAARDKDAADASSKRKRRPSSPAAPIKLFLASPETNGTLGAKRAKVGTGAAEDAEEAGDDAGRASETTGRVLSADVRGALATVISQMASGLPSPLNGILTLWLPPSFEEVDENTLGHLLRQADLTWERLVDTLHVFSENLLLPCSYPNPFPSLARVRLPAPPLPSHFPPLHVYTFCAALHPLVLGLEPGRPAVDLARAPERWALVQKTPPSGASGGEWFTSAADLGAVEKAERVDGPGLLGRLAAASDKLGYATPVSLQTTSQPPAHVPRLGETVIRRASLKAQRWKEQRLSRRAGGGFGAISAPVRAVAGPSAAAGPSWSPSFAPTMDSSHSAGAGWDSTVCAMHEKARVRAWRRAVGAWARGPEGEGWHGVLEDASRRIGDADDEAEAEDEDDAGMSVCKDKGKGRSVNDVLAGNAALIAELQAWQDLRLVQGDQEWITQREQLAADQLLASLAELAARAEPADLVPSAQSAHALAAKHVPTPGPLVRGTLDPRRPAALHDNTTVRLSPHALALAAAPAASIHLPPPASAAAAPAPAPAQRGTEPPPHTLPPAMRRPAPASAQQLHASRSLNAAPSPLLPQGAPYRRPTAPGSPSPSPAPYAAASRPGPGPSGLRQSYGPGAYGR